MNELSAIKSIDFVLNFFATHKVAERYMPFDVIQLYCIKPNGESFGNNELGIILDKLEKDNYIVNKEVTNQKNNEKKHVYFISFEGKIFYSQGGYEKEIIRQSAENMRVETLEVSSRKQADTLNRLTFWIALASGIAACYYLVELWKHFHCK